MKMLDSVKQEDEYSRAPTPLEHNASATRSLVCGPLGGPIPPYPVFMQGEVMRGFGRGSKDLGCPTANLPDASIAPYTKVLETGVHYGYAQVDFGPEHNSVYPMVMSIGWNPYYKNERRTAEVHILHDYPHDFYGHELRIIILGFIRPEYNYTSLEALIEDIETDKKATLVSLNRPTYARFQRDERFTKDKPPDP